MSGVSVEEANILQLRIKDFKSDPDVMEDLNCFIEDLYEQATKEAERRKMSEAKKTKLMELKGLEHLLVRLVLKLAHLQPGYSRRSATAQIQLKVL